ncbi:MAG TPA: DUF2917 domain-containing protein [Burkholderiales bacterium]|nr:DUF2917 domain-containing protein [Burkholderiales bacterium]
MQLEIKASTVTLSRESLMAIQDAPGTRVLVRAGTVWVTQEGESKDSVVRTGEVFTIRMPGRTIISTLEASTLSLIDADVPEPTVLRQRLRQPRAIAEPVAC